MAQRGLRPRAEKTARAFERAYPGGPADRQVNEGSAAVLSSPRVGLPTCRERCDEVWRQSFIHIFYGEPDTAKQRLSNVAGFRYTRCLSVNFSEREKLKGRHITDNLGQRRGDFCHSKEPSGAARSKSWERGRMVGGSMAHYCWQTASSYPISHPLLTSTPI